MRSGRFAVATAFLTLGACASVPPPHDRLASSQASIRGAEEAGVDGIPKAELELKLAQDGVERARALMKSGDNQEATTVLLKAQADAELAIVLARDGRARNDAAAAKAQVEQLESSMK